MIRRRSALVWIFVALLAVVSGGCDEILEGLGFGGGDGDSSGQGTPNTSELAGIQALGMVIQNANGIASADLAVVTTSGQPHFLKGVRDASLEQGEQKVSLLATEQDGIWAANSQVDSNFIYRQGERYRFRFRMVDTGDVEREFSGEVKTPTVRPQIEAAIWPMRWAGEAIEVELRGEFDGGFLRVFGPSGLTYTTEPSFDLADLYGVEAGLRSFSPQALRTGSFEIPGAAFPRPGEYRIQYTGLAIEVGGTNVGSLSFFAAGVSAELRVTVD